MSVSAHALLDCRVSTPDGTSRCKAVLPFFTRRLDVRFLLLVFPNGDLLVVHDLPRTASGRILDYSTAPRLRELALVRPEEVSDLLHYDPWWLLRDRSDVPAALRDAIVATNIADLRVDGKRLSTVSFDDSLLAVTGVQVPRFLIGSRCVPREDLHTVFQ